jgi:hypothetical protein
MKTQIQKDWLAISRLQEEVDEWKKRKQKIETPYQKECIKLIEESLEILKRRYCGEKVERV